MFPVPDALAGFYLFCFAVGFVFVFASLFLGFGHDALHLPGFGDGGGVDQGAGLDTGSDLGGLDHGGGVDTGGQDAGGGNTGSAGDAPHGVGSAHDIGHQGGGHGISPINLSTIMAFLTWFGGAGYILRVYAGLLGVVSVAVATLAGLAGGAMIFYFLARVLIPGQKILDPADYQMEGTVARVTMPVGPDVVGEIVYSKGGSRRSDGARSVDGSTIERGTEVVVVRYEKGIAYVEPWSSYIAQG